MATPARVSRIRTAKQPELARAQDNVARVLEPVVKALSMTPIMGAMPIWLSPQLLSGYVNFNAVGGAYATAGYYRDSLSRVWSKGTLYNPTGGTLTASNPVLQFPAGYLPGERQRLDVVGDAASFQFVTVEPNGFVYPGVDVGSPGSLDIFFSFLAEH